jgi:hypothetical protein
VPLLGFSWVCVGGQAPLLKGHAPLGKQAEFQASSITLGDDLERLSLANLRLNFPLPSFRVQVRTRHALLSGLPPWGRSRRLPLALRALLFASSAGISAYGVARLIERQTTLPRWLGVLLGLCVAGCLWFALSWLERHELRPLSYLALPAAGAIGVALSALGLWLRDAIRGRSGPPPARPETP